MNPRAAYEVTEAFEKAICEYTGAPYCCVVDSCSSALLMALTYDNVKGKIVEIPNRTYMSVPNSIISAGGIVKFYEVPGETIKGAYRLNNTDVVDSALKFTADMYWSLNEYYTCLSFSGPYKHLKLGKGGAILTDSQSALRWFKKARFSGRNEVSYHIDSFDQLGWNCYMLPEIAARGLVLMNQFYNLDGSKKHNDDLELPYPDLSKFSIYQQ